MDLLDFGFVFLCLVSIFPAMAEEIDINKRLDEFYIKYKRRSLRIRKTR